jgi:hypothetical protein
VGDGHHTAFWLDAWCSSDDLSTMFPVLFSHARFKDISVHGLLEQGLSTSLDGHLSTQVSDELSSLENLMSGVSLTNTPVCATALQQINPDGFKRKSFTPGYRREAFCLSSLSGFIWKSHAPPRVKFFYLDGVVRSPSVA